LRITDASRAVVVTSAFNIALHTARHDRRTTGHRCRRLSWASASRRRRARRSSRMAPKVVEC